MAGTDTVRGIAYQAIRSVLTALDCLDDPDFHHLRFEGIEDLYDVEVFDHDGHLILVQQIKTKVADYSWSKSAIRDLMSRWSDLNPLPTTRFEFVTNGRLGPRLTDVLQLETRDDAIEHGASLASVVAERADLAPIASRARIVVDTATEDALFSRAMRRVRSRLISVRGDLDATEQATASINAFYIEVISRSSLADPDGRLFSREEIGSLLSIDAGANRGDEWADRMRDDYIASVLSEETDLTLVPPRFEPTGAPPWQGGAHPVGVEGLSSKEHPTIILGPTGSGKSTAVAWLRSALAQSNEIAIVIRAESYRSGRLAASIRTELEARLGRQVSMQAARSVLEDPSVTLVIDGASEIARESRVAMAEDLSAIAMERVRRPRLLLVGRNVAPMRGMLPTTVTPRILAVAGLSKSEQELIALMVMGSGEDAATAVADIRRALGNGSEVPLLFRLALNDRSAGGMLSSRAELYSRLFLKLFERAGAENYALTLAAAGCAFAGLLDEGTRATDSLHWEAGLAGAVRRLAPDSDNGALEDVRRSIRKSGLVVEIGFGQTLVPTHDSFADYLAGRAHALGFASWPSVFQEQDEERLRFANEVRSLATPIVRRVVETAPALVPRLAATAVTATTSAKVTADVDPTSLEEMMTVLTGEPLPVGLFRDTSDRRWAVFLAEGPSRELPVQEGPTELRRLGGVQLERGALSGVATLWRWWLIRRLSTFSKPKTSGGVAIDEASIARCLADHTLGVARAAGPIVNSLVPQPMRPSVIAAVGNLEKEIVVTHDSERSHAVWPILYRPSERTSVRFMALPLFEQLDWSDGSHGHTDALTALQDSTTATAARLVQAAVNDLTLPHWL